MNVTEQKANGLTRKYNVVITAEEFSAAVDKELADVAKDVKMPGFRAGKAPKSMIEQKYRPSVLGKVLDEVIRNAVNNVVAQNNLRPAVYPDVKIEKFEDGKDIEITVEAEVLPQIELGDFSKISLKKYVAKVPAEDVEKTLQQLAATQRNTAKIEADRAAKKGDVAVIDFVGSIDGVEFEGGKGNNYPLELGSNSFIPGYEDQLIGHKAGETVEVRTSFPENYHAKNLAGKEALFVTTIKELREFTPVEINDDFAKKYGVKDLSELKAAIEARIAENYGATTHLKLKRDLLDALDKEYKFEIPQKLVDAEYEMIEKQYQNAKANNRLDAADANRDEKDVLAEYKDIALRRVKLGLVLSEVSNKEKIVLTAEDINQAIMNEAKKYPGQEKAVFDYYVRNKEALEALRAPAFEEKIINFVLSKVKVTETEVSAAELFGVNKDEVAASAEKTASAKSSSKASAEKKAEKKVEKKATDKKSATKAKTADKKAAKKPAKKGKAA